MNALVLASLGHKAPHVVLMVADDMGYAQIGYHNASTLTPNIDSIAREGVVLENYYVQPVCSPTRSSLMTGRYTYRLGTQATVIRADVPFGVPLKETMLGENLQAQGYTTGLFGKWHLLVATLRRPSPLLIICGTQGLLPACVHADEARV